MNSKAQGAMEYLLLLAAAVVVVAIVISFMIGTINPVQEGANTQNLDFVCKTLNTNSLTCGCYLCKANLIGYSQATGKNEKPNDGNCTALSQVLNNSLLRGAKCSTGYN